MVTRCVIFGLYGVLFFKNWMSCQRLNSGRFHPEISNFLASLAPSEDLATPGPRSSLAVVSKSGCCLFAVLPRCPLHSFVLLARTRMALELEAPLWELGTFSLLVSGMHYRRLVLYSNEQSPAVFLIAEHVERVTLLGI